jgi:hypothetical protein
MDGTTLQVGYHLIRRIIKRVLKNNNYARKSKKKIKKRIPCSATL